MNSNVSASYARRPQKWIANLILVIVIFVLLVVSFTGADINLNSLSQAGFKFKTMFERIVKINWEYFFGYGMARFDDGIVYKMLETIAMTLFGTLIGAFLAIPFGFLAAQNVVGKKWAKVCETILVLIRVFPELILALILVKGLGMTPLTVILTIGFHSIGMLGKLFAESIDNMDRSSLEALDSVGANLWQKIRYGIVPNIMPELTSMTLYRFDINLRSATIFGLVGAGGIGLPLQIALSNTSAPAWEMAGTVLLAIVVMVLVVDFLSGYLRNKLV